jgi:hypothetical protein
VETIYPIEFVGFWHITRQKEYVICFTLPISLLEGEMPGRAEGGKPHIKTFVSCTLSLGTSEK